MVRLLIVDDEDEVRCGIRDVIDWEANGVLVCGTASNGNEALRLIYELSPDILLIDIRMPGMDGLQVIESIRATDYPIKPIILSGYDDFAYAQKAIKLGACDYLLKPCRPQEILETILRVKSLVEAESSRKPTSEKLCQSVKLTYDGTNSKKSGSKIIELCLKFIEENYHKDLSLETVAGSVFITSGYLSLLFKQVMGINFVDYLHKIRVERACEVLRDVRLKTYEVAFKVGYKDEKYFCQIFKRYTGMTPTQYRENL